MKTDEKAQILAADIDSGNREEMLKLFTETARVLPPGHPSVVGKKGNILPRRHMLPAKFCL